MSSGIDGNIEVFTEDRYSYQYLVSAELYRRRPVVYRSFASARGYARLTEQGFTKQGLVTHDVWVYGVDGSLTSRTEQVPDIDLPIPDWATEVQITAHFKLVTSTDKSVDNLSNPV